MTDRVRTILAGRERDFLWVFTAAPSRKYPDGGNQISERRLIIEASAQEDWTFSSGQAAHISTQLQFESAREGRSQLHGQTMGGTRVG